MCEGEKAEALQPNWGRSIDAKHSTNTDLVNKEQEFHISESHTHTHTLSVPHILQRVAEILESFAGDSGQKLGDTPGANT